MTDFEKKKKRKYFNSKRKFTEKKRKVKKKNENFFIQLYIHLCYKKKRKFHVDNGTNNDNYISMDYNIILMKLSRRETGKKKKEFHPRAKYYKKTI